jgi:hypothetical protein
MAIFLLWGIQLESYYGTIYYAGLNICLAFLSNFMNIGAEFLFAYYFPETIFGYKIGGPKAL